MATIKSYTDINQSKKLASILPLESADMRYEYPSREKDEIQEPMNGFHTSSFNWFKESDSFIYIPCWSLAALLGVLPKRIKHCNVLTIDISEDEFAMRYDEIAYRVNNDLPDITKDNPIDACYEMILKLHELKML